MNKQYKNRDIREAVIAAHLHYYEVADALGIADSTFSRRLRYELPEDEKKTVMAAINQLKEEK